MTEPHQRQYDTLREAFSVVYRCPPAEFDRQVFWKCLYAHAWLPAHWMWWFEREFFRIDLEAIHAMGAARCEADLQRAIDDLENQGLVERSFRRGRLLFRLSSSRLIRLLRPLLPLLKPLPLESGELAPITPIPDQVRAVRDRPTRTNHAVRPGERVPGGTQMVRILKRLHSDVVSGQPLDRALAEAGLTRAEAEAALADAAVGRPELQWLRGYFQLLDEAEIWRIQNKTRPTPE